MAVSPVTSGNSLQGHTKLSVYEWSQGQEIVGFRYSVLPVDASISITEDELFTMIRSVYERSSRRQVATSSVSLD